MPLQASAHLVLTKPVQLLEALPLPFLRKLLEVSPKVPKCWYVPMLVFITFRLSSAKDFQPAADPDACDCLVPGLCHNFSLSVHGVQGFWPVVRNPSGNQQLAVRSSSTSKAEPSSSNSSPHWLQTPLLGPGTQESYEARSFLSRFQDCKGTGTKI